MFTEQLKKYGTETPEPKFFELVRKGVFNQSVFKGYPDLIENIDYDEPFGVEEAIVC